MVEALLAAATSTVSVRILIRVDSSANMGAGHVMRCRALAVALRDRKAAVSFVARREPGAQIEMLQAAGFSVLHLPPAGKSIDDLTDAAETLKAASGEGPFDAALVDHYGLGLAWEKQVRAKIPHVMAIDDLPDRRHAVDLLLDQNVAADGPDEAAARGAGVFLRGPAYALLRDQFRDARRDLNRRDGRLERILIYHGSVDLTDETGKATRALLGVKDRGYEIEVVVGAANAHRDAVRALCAAHPGVSFRCQIDDVAATMARADLTLGAAGVSAWERCCVGLPSLLTVVSKDQIPVARTVAANGAGIDMGWYEGIAEGDYACVVAGLERDQLARMEAASLALVDGRGAERVADAIFGVLDGSTRSHSAGGGDE